MPRSSSLWQQQLVLHFPHNHKPHQLSFYNKKDIIHPQTQFVISLLARGRGGLPPSSLAWTSFLKLKQMTTSTTPHHIKERHDGDNRKIAY
jgi:hypothetical protein